MRSQHKVNKNSDKVRVAHPTYQTKEGNGVSREVVVGQNLGTGADAKCHVWEFLHHIPEHGHYWYF